MVGWNPGDKAKRCECVDAGLDSQGVKCWILSNKNNVIIA